MTRPIRIQFAGALYHVTARGDRKRGIFHDDLDRMVWLKMLAETCSRYHFIVLSYCQMGNHYHLVLETVEANLSDGMRYLNAYYSAYFNRKHGLVGHVFQGRYKAILCERETYLLELVRYVVLNPVRAGLVHSPEQWPWSSHRAMLGISEVHSWLDAKSVMHYFANGSDSAIDNYRAFVEAGRGMVSPLSQTSHQAVLGTEDFVVSVTTHAKLPQSGISRVQRRIASQPLSFYFAMYPFDEACARAYQSTVYSMEEIARHCGRNAKKVSRAIRRFERQVADGQATNLTLQSSEGGDCRI